MTRPALPRSKKAKKHAHGTMLAAVFLLGSCAIPPTGDEPPRQTIRFSSLRAAQLFHAHYRPTAEETAGIFTEVTSTGSRQVTYPGGGRLHAAITAADLDGNGVITEKEAAVSSI